MLMRKGGIMAAPELTDALLSSPLALAIAEIPGAARDIKRSHYRTSDGRCAVCMAGPQRGHVLHPCHSYVLATAAQAVIAQRKAAE
jgi:hypothetical protein